MINILKIIFLVMKNPKDELLRFKLLRKIGKTVLPRYRFKWPQLSWWEDQSFNDYLHRFDEIRGANTDRRWMLYQLMRLVGKVPGDTAECGVYKGASSYLIGKVNLSCIQHVRTHYMFDSYAGLSEPGSGDGVHWDEGALCIGIEDVKKNLGGLGGCKLMKGWIPDRFEDVSDRTFAFVHIDVDLYQPTHDSIAFFYPRMNEGGIIVCDDYGFTSCPGATKAVDEFLADKPEKMIEMSGGGGFFIKGWETSEAVGI